jgi:DNA-binding SARP family transcriptional activator
MEKHSFDSNLIRQIIFQATQAPNLKIESLGLFKIWRNEQLIGQWPDSRAEALVKILLTRQLGDNQSVSAAELLELLWSRPEEWDYKNLLPLIRTAQQSLEPGVDPRESSFILRGFNGYYFDVAGNIEWDVLRFRQLAQQGKYLVDAHQWQEALQTLEKAESLYKGEYLAEDKEAAWALEFRRQLKREYTSLLTDLADVYAAQKRYEDGIRVCTQALVSDPLIESVYRRLIRFYYWQGQKEAALKIYRDCVKLFEDLFGESPKPITRHLYEAIVKDEPIVNTLLDSEVALQSEDHFYPGE